MENEEIELPPGFRFHPTDEELITHYLSPKVINCNFNAIAIGEADLNKSEPWDLPGRAKMGEKEWYFFCVKDRKYPTGMRTNRATESGYWKATGKDKEIYRGKKLVGMKKTLVFYKGRAPKGEKSNWVMHEYRLEAKFPVSLPDYHHLLLSKSIKNNEWVICRIFKKSIGEKRTHISELITSSSSPLPPLMDYSFSPYNNEPRASHVTTFSNLMELETNKQPQSNMIYNFKTQTPLNNNVISTNLENQDSVWKHGNFPMMKKLIENQRQIPKMEFSQYSQDVSAFNSGIIMDNSCVEDEDYDPSISDGPIDLESLWNY